MSENAGTSQEGPAQELWSILNAHYRFQYLSAAFRFGLFTLLSEKPGSTRAEIAARIGLRDQSARVLLLGCTAFGLTQKIGEGYHNTAITRPLAGPPNQLPSAIVPWQHQAIYPALWWFYDSLKQGTNVGLRRGLGGTTDTIYEHLADDADLEKTFHTAMSLISELGARELAQKLDLSKYQRVLDVGGGTALHATTFARRWPHLRITVAEIPTVAAAAREHIAGMGLSDRVDAVSLDALKDEFPGGYDCVLFAHFLDGWSAERIQSLLGKANRAVGPDGGVLVVTPRQDDDETGPEMAAELSAYYQTILSGEGMVYTAREFEQWLTEAGFEPGERIYVQEFGEVVIPGVKMADVGAGTV